jgi:hypothetical protein
VASVTAADILTARGCRERNRGVWAGMCRREHMRQTRLGCCRERTARETTGRSPFRAYLAEHSLPQTKTAAAISQAATLTRSDRALWDLKSLCADRELVASGAEAVPGVTSGDERRGAAQVRPRRGVCCRQMVPQRVNFLTKQVEARPLQGRGRRFEPCSAHHHFTRFVGTISPRQPPL